MNSSTEMPTTAFVLRMAHGRDRLSEGLADGVIVSGWARARGLREAADWGDFRSIIKAAYHADEPGFRRAGAAAGHAWNFVHDMVTGSWVVVPRSGEFYVAQVRGDVSYDESKVADDSAYRRPVVWLNDGKGIPRRLARAALQSRMKVQGSTAVASDLVSDIAECVALAGVPAGQQPSFGNDLRAKLVAQTLDELRSGRIDPYGFERVIAALLRATGGQSVRVVPRLLDKGADVLATFKVAGALRLRIAVQAKHFGIKAPAGRDVVQQLLDGMDAEQADMGIVATSGVFSDDAAAFAAELLEVGKRVELVDGEQLAAMIVDCGLGTVELNG